MVAEIPWPVVISPSLAHAFTVYACAYILWRVWAPDYIGLTSKCALSSTEMHLPCITWRHQTLQCGVCINSRILSSSIASPLPTLSDLVDHEWVKWPSPSISSTYNTCAYFRVRAFCAWHNLFEHVQDILIPYQTYCWAKTWLMHSERCTSLGSMLTSSTAFHRRLFIYLGCLPQLCFDMEPFSIEHAHLHRGFAL